MYFFVFDAFAGDDKIFIYEPKSEIGVGDLIDLDGRFLLCLGKNIAFKEKYTYVWRSDKLEVLVYKKLLNFKSIKLLNRMVKKYISNYKTVLKYFLSFDLVSFLKRKSSFVENKRIEQSLVVYPDVWTMYNMVSDDALSGENCVFLNSKMTPKQKDLAWWKIKFGLVDKIFCTHSEMFQNWQNLSNIEIIDNYKWYYKNHQDPRYDTNKVLVKMAKIWGCSLNFVF